LNTGERYLGSGAQSFVLVLKAWFWLAKFRKKCAINVKGVHGARWWAWKKKSHLSLTKKMVLGIISPRGLYSKFLKVNWNFPRNQSFMALEVRSGGGTHLSRTCTRSLQQRCRLKGFGDASILQYKAS
jgi:hypothetical protein